MSKQSNTPEQAVDTTVEIAELPPLTPWGAHLLVNAVLRAEGIKEIPPQMMYNYTSSKYNKGEKPLIKFTPEDGVDRDALEAWLNRYVAKKQTAAQAARDEAAAGAPGVDYAAQILELGKAAEVVTEVIEGAEVVESE